MNYQRTKYQIPEAHEQYYDHHHDFEDGSPEEVYAQTPYSPFEHEDNVGSPTDSTGDPMLSYVQAGRHAYAGLAEKYRDDNLDFPEVPRTAPIHHYHSREREEISSPVYSPEGYGQFTDHHHRRRESKHRQPLFEDWSPTQPSERKHREPYIEGWSPTQPAGYEQVAEERGRRHCDDATPVQEARRKRQDNVPAPKPRRASRSASQHQAPRKYMQHSPQEEAFQEAVAYEQLERDDSPSPSPPPREAPRQRQSHVLEPEVSRTARRREPQYDLRQQNREHQEHRPREEKQEQRGRYRSRVDATDSFPTPSVRQRSRAVSDLESDPCQQAQQEQEHGHHHLSYAQEVSFRGEQAYEEAQAQAQSQAQARLRGGRGPDNSTHHGRPSVSRRQTDVSGPALHRETAQRQRDYHQQEAVRRDSLRAGERVEHRPRTRRESAAQRISIHPNGPISVSVGPSLSRPQSQHQDEQAHLQRQETAKLEERFYRLRTQAFLELSRSSTVPAPPPQHVINAVPSHRVPSSYAPPRTPTTPTTPTTPSTPIYPMSSRVPPPAPSPPLPPRAPSRHHTRSGTWQSEAHHSPCRASRRMSVSASAEPRYPKPVSVDLTRDLVEKLAEDSDAPQMTVPEAGSMVTQPGGPAGRRPGSREHHRHQQQRDERYNSREKRPRRGSFLQTITSYMRT